MIAGVEIKQLKQLTDDRGFLMEVLRGSDAIKEGGASAFGQYYVMTVNPRVIKGKHFHKLQIDHMTAIKGKAVIHLEDTREGSATNGQKEVIEFGEGNFRLVKIPPGVWHSVENVGDEVVYIVNYVTAEYDAKEPDEFRAVFDVKDKKMPWKPLITG